MILKLIFAMVIVLGSLLIISKLASNKVSKINESKYIKVLERSQISKNSYIMVLKIGEKGYLISNCDGKTEMIDTISKEEIEKLERIKKEEKEKVQGIYEDLYKKWHDKSKYFIKRFKKKWEKLI